MYLRSVLELEEEGMIRFARGSPSAGAERAHVSQTVARMQRDGLLTVTGDAGSSSPPTDAKSRPV